MCHKQILNIIWNVLYSVRLYRIIDRRIQKCNQSFKVAGGQIMILENVFIFWKDKKMQRLPAQASH